MEGPTAKRPRLGESDSADHFEIPNLANLALLRKEDLGGKEDYPDGLGVYYNKQDSPEWLHELFTAARSVGTRRVGNLCVARLPELEDISTHLPTHSLTSRACTQVSPRTPTRVGGLMLKMIIAATMTMITVYSHDC